MADSIFLGDVITMADGRTTAAEAVAVRCGRVVAVGSEDDVMSLVMPDTKIRAMRDKVILPGLIEPHTHPEITALNNNRLDISGFNPLSNEEVWQKISDAVNKTPSGEWVVVAGFNPILVPGLQSPTKMKLDEIAPENPIVILTSTLHSCFVNSLAFAIAGITDDTPDPPSGGAYIRDPDGRLTGKCDESLAIVSIVTHLPKIAVDVATSSLRHQFNHYAENGYTTIASMSISNIVPDTASIMQQMVSSPMSPVRMVVYQRGSAMRKSNYSKGRPGVDNFCNVGVKYWADGSPYSGTMATSEPYLDTELTRDGLQFAPYPSRGHLNYNRDRLYRELVPHHTQGWQIAVHAHGERAIDTTLDVYEHLMKDKPRADHRHRLEHCGLITKAQLVRAKQLGVTPSFFVDHIYYFGRALRDSILGSERAARFMPLYTANQEGHQWSLHSDTPCCPLGPFRVLKTAVTRQTRRELADDKASRPQVIGPEERVAIDDALKAYTTHAAWQLFHEDVIGSIEVGKIADFTVVSDNPRHVDPNDLDTIDVVSTYRNGVKVVPFTVKL